MTADQEDEINKLLEFLQSSTQFAATAARRERSRRLWDSVIALRSERDALRIEVLKHLDLVK